MSASFVQHDNGEYLAGIQALERDFPRFVKVSSFSKFFGKEMLSAGGREMYIVEITDFRAPEKNKEAVLASLSVHGLERAGLEGGVRYMEDLARWAAEEPDHELRNGTEKDSIGITVADALKKVHLYLTSVNPDGWARGDLANGGVYQRGNANGIDLNRQFPTIGWMNTTRPLPMTETEAVAMVKLERKVDPVITTDLHGELTSAQNAFADMMYPAGQWDPLRQKQHERLARHMKSNVERWFEERGVEASTVSGNAEMKPAEYATGYDVVGYDDSGFMGDYFTTRGAIDMDVEHFLSHQAPNSTWVPPLEEAHIMSVRGEIETLVVEATVTRKVKTRLKLGRVGYLFDPKVIKSSDGHGAPLPEAVTAPKYKSTRMQYFRDLAEYSTKPVRKVWSNQALKARTLKRLDTLVIADNPAPPTRKGARVNAKKLATSLSRWVKGGGNLVLTDKAVKLLSKMKVVPGGAVSKQLYNAGHVDIETWDDPYVAKVHDTASQTYYEVALGFNPDADASPHWVVARPEWEEAGGTVIAYVTDEANVGLGRIEHGKGTIGILGAVLPAATEKSPHPYGLADYAVTVAGGQILQNMITYRR